MYNSEAGISAKAELLLYKWINMQLTRRRKRLRRLEVESESCNLKLVYNSRESSEEFLAFYGNM